MKNTKENTKKKKGGVTGKGFDVNGQPSPSAKSKGWEERRQKQKLMDILSNYGDMSYKEVTELMAKIKEHPENYTLDEVRLAGYMSKDKYVTDYLDRMGAKARTQVDVTTDGEALQGTQLIVNLVDELNKLDEETEQGEDSSPTPVQE